MKKIILFSILFVIIAGGFYVYSEYNRTNKDLKKVRADVSIEAPALIAAFEKDSASFKQKFIDKVIAVNGTVKSIDMNGTPVVIAMGLAGEMSSVQCSMDTSYTNEYKPIKEGDHLTIKGKCAGGRTEDLFGTDVILNRCVIETIP